MAYGTVTVTATATLIRPANCDRRELRIVNFSDVNVVYLGQDASVVDTDGFPLYQNQNMLHTKDNGMWLGAVYGICSAAATADVRYWETEGT